MKIVAFALMAAAVVSVSSVASAQGVPSRAPVYTPAPQPVYTPTSRTIYRQPVAPYQAPPAAYAPRGYYAPARSNYSSGPRGAGSKMHGNIYRFWK